MKRWEWLLIIFIVGVFGQTLGSWLWLEGLPRVSGTLFPVTSQSRLYNPQPYPPPSFRYVWEATATKYRTNCTFDHIEWFLGHRGETAIRVEAKFIDAPQTRGQGELHWDGLVVTLDPDQVLSNSFGDVIHNCAYTPWQVRTPYFTADPNNIAKNDHRK